ncbi:MAG: ribosomal protein S18-alanine N-acetyltransferase [Gemmobacter sp.]
MTAEGFAALHARAFVVPRPWTAGEFAALLRERSVVVLVEPSVGYMGPEDGAVAGFLLARVVLDEAEILTLAVEPACQGQGIGGRLVARCLDEMQARGGGRAFLEVAEDNAPARAVYGRAGFAEVGRRRGYFAAPGRAAVDALVLARDLTIF